jgi:putative intracellular protease/amidase
MSSPRTLGVLLFEGFELLDVFGPCEAFGIRDLDGAFRLAMVAAKAGSIASAQGPRVVAEFGFDDCPPLDVILVPGGIGTRREVDNDALTSWLRTRAEQSNWSRRCALVRACSRAPDCSTGVARPPTNARSRGSRVRALT